MKAVRNIVSQMRLTMMSSVGCLTSLSKQTPYKGSQMTASKKRDGG
jgi:hypothetical protein